MWQKGKIETLTIVAVKAGNQRYFVKPTSGKTGPFTDFLTVCKSFPLLMSAIHNNCHERCYVKHVLTAVWKENNCSWN